MSSEDPNTPAEVKDLWMQPEYLPSRIFCVFSEETKHRYKWGRGLRAKTLTAETPFPTPQDARDSVRQAYLAILNDAMAQASDLFIPLHRGDGPYIPAISEEIKRLRLEGHDLIGVARIDPIKLGANNAVYEITRLIFSSTLRGTRPFEAAPSYFVTGNIPESCIMTVFSHSEFGKEFD